MARRYNYYNRNSRAQAGYGATPAAKEATREIRHFANTTALQTWLEPLIDGQHHFNGASPESERRVRDACAMLTTGDTKPIPRVMELVSKLQDAVPSIRQVWRHDVAGFFPDVPAYLAGEPESMWKLDKDESDHAPLRVWVGITTSAMISEDLILKRGATLAAFAMALSERRTVYITPYVILGSWDRRHDAYISWDLQTSPMVIAEVVASLTNASITRYLGIHACHKLNDNVQGAWPSAYGNETAMREILGCAPGDLFLDALHAYDPLVTEPEKWIREQINFHLNMEEGE